MGFFFDFLQNFKKFLIFCILSKFCKTKQHLKKSIIFKILNFYYLILVNDMQMQNRIGRNR